MVRKLKRKQEAKPTGTKLKQQDIEESAPKKLKANTTKNRKRKATEMEEVSQLTPKKLKGG